MGRDSAEPRPGGVTRWRDLSRASRLRDGSHGSGAVWIETDYKGQRSRCRDRREPTRSRRDNGHRWCPPIWLECYGHLNLVVRSDRGMEGHARRCDDCA